MIYEPTVITRREMVQIDDTARIDGFVKIEGGLGVKIGPYVHVASFAHINIGSGEVVLEEGSAVASGGRIVGGSNLVDSYSCSAAAPPSWQNVARKKTVLGRNVIVFANGVVLPGVTMGEGSVLAAGAVLTKDTGPYEIWAGVPAKYVGDRPRHPRPEGE